ncbi:MAG: hypothetical protein ACREBS_10535 [Nitrososphaerales archaeon]
MSADVLGSTRHEAIVPRGICNNNAANFDDFTNNSFAEIPEQASLRN